MVALSACKVIQRMPGGGCVVTKIAGVPFGFAQGRLSTSRGAFRLPRSAQDDTGCRPRPSISGCGTISFLSRDSRLDSIPPMPCALFATFSHSLGRRIGLLAALAVVVGVSALLCGQTLPTAPGAAVSLLTPAPGPFTEPGIAVNPSNPQQVVAVFQDNAHASYSQDAGRTWHAAEGVASENYKVSGDVSAAFDNLGHAFICYIAFDKLGTFNYWAHNATRNGVFVRRSLDGGKTWEKDAVAVIAHASDPGIPFEDKPYIVADATHSKYAGNLYI